MRKNLYQATLEQHIAVEGIFNFENGLSENNLTLFHITLYRTRKICQPILNQLEINHKIPTYNKELIQELEKDLVRTNIKLNSTPVSNQLSNLPSENISVQAGVFYVFAGSSMGAKSLLSMAKKQSLILPLHYLNSLVDRAKHQMTTLNQLLTNEHLEELLLIESAQLTFNLIHNIASNELQKRNTEFRGA